ncbi:hypothetical protein XI09_33310 [Bradyrhizobium sp. CCBAU 11386]|nr:hypothetical protein [Bradyrhizobium sp. CCBAU 11386]
MVGEVEPLKALESEETRKGVLERILKEYPTKTLKPDNLFYRIRVAPSVPENAGEYDSPPKPSDNPGRLDSLDLRVMYGSQDLQVCIHECRVTADDDLFVATLAPKKDLKLLDLTELLVEEHATEFKSLDMAVHMLFLAGKHSYQIAREVALAAQRVGFDGVLYPSYFSMLRSGGIPFETLTGISHRRIPKFSDREKAKIVPNIAIFGRPLSEEKVEIKSINRLILARVEYDVRFGPVGYQWTETGSENL